MLAVLFVLENTQFFGLDDFFDYYLLFTLRIILWTALGIAVMRLPSARTAGLLRLRGMVIALAFLFSILYLFCFMIIGLLTSFGKSIYSLSPIGVAMNLVPMVAALAGGELCRAFLIGNLSGKRPYRVILGTGLLFSLFNLSIQRIGNIDGNMEILDYLTATVFQQLTLSLAASCLAYLAGPLPAIVYLGVIRAFGFLSPYIPDPDLIPRMLFNTLLPTISIYLIMWIYAREASEYGRGGRKEGVTRGGL
jgi:hypothetical protein